MFGNYQSIKKYCFLLVLVFGSEKKYNYNIVLAMDPPQKKYNICFQILQNLKTYCKNKQNTKAIKKRSNKKKGVKTIYKQLIKAMPY